MNGRVFPELLHSIEVVSKVRIRLRMKIPDSSDNSWRLDNDFYTVSLSTGRTWIDPSSIRHRFHLLEFGFTGFALIVIDGHEAQSNLVVDDSSKRTNESYDCCSTFDMNSLHHQESCNHLASPEQMASSSLTNRSILGVLRGCP